MNEDDSMKHEGKWTRDDLPRIGTPNPAHDSVVGEALDTVMHWLNKYYPKPGGSFAVMLEDTHRAQRERDESLRKKGEAFDRAVRAERERDAAVARAEALDKQLAKVMSDYQDLEDELDAAVARADIEKVVEAVFDREAGYDYGSDKPWPGTEPVTSAVWDYLKGTDPAVYVVRESDIEDCQRNEDGDWEFRHSGRVFHDSRDPADCAESLAHHREQIAQRVAIVRAIEAEQAVDPVGEKARELYRAATPDARWETVADEYRRIARHVLRQEAGE